jgi:hypothetical protein
MKQLSHVEKITLLFHFACFFLLSFTDAALWNDGVHFLYRIIDQQSFWVDSYWLRYSDVIFQIPTLLSLSTIGISAFTNWVFKATLLLLPFCVLVPFLQRHAGHGVAKYFVFLIITLVMPFGLLFPIGTYNISLVAGALILGALLSEKRRPLDIAIFLCSHVVLFFGHELGVSIPLIVIVYSACNYHLNFFKKMSFKYLLCSEVLFLIGLILFRLPLMMKNQNYVASLPFYGWDFQYTLYLYLFLLGLSGLVMRGLWSKLLHGLFLMWFLYELYVIDGHYFYSAVYLGRYLLFPFAGLVFLFCWIFPHLRASKYSALVSVVLLMAISSKAAYLWGQLELEENLIGCSEIKLPEHGWLPPEWSIPFYSLVKQTTEKPRMILVGPSVQCQRFGRYFLFGKDVVYHVTKFDNKIDGSLLLQAIPQARMSLPYRDTEQKLRLPEGAELELKPVGEYPDNSCLKLGLKSFGGISEVEVTADGTLLVMPQFGEEEQIFYQRLNRSFELLHLRFRTPTQINVSEAMIVSCPDKSP